MTRMARAFVSACCLGCLCFGIPAFSQTTPAPKPSEADRASAYYNFAMGHLYAELAATSGNRGDFYSKAIDFYKQALKDDPSATFLSEELTELYVQGNQMAKAVAEAEDLLKQNPNNLDARRLLGRIYMRMIGDGQQNKVNEEMLRKAIEQYQKVTQGDPKDLEGWLILGRLERVAHHSPEAEKAYKEVLAKEPDNEEALTSLASVYADVGDTKNAIELLKRASEKNPNGKTFAAVAQFYEQLRDFPNAADAWKQALKQNPSESHYKRALALDLRFADKLDEALALYKEIGAEDPRDVQVQLRMAEIYRQKRDFENARASLEKAKALDAGNIEVRYDEVNLLDAEGKSDQAIATLKGIIDETAKKQYTDGEKDSRASLLERLGILYRSGGKYQESIAAFRQMAALNGENAPRALAETVETYRIAKDLNGAKQEADSALKKYPKDRTVALVHASLMGDLGKTDQAVSEIRALMNGERDRDLLLNIASIYEKAKRFPEETKVLDEAEKASSTKQEKESVEFVRGSMYERMKNFDSAEAAFRKVLAGDPDNAGALNYLGYMLADRNVRLDEAQKLISRALEIDPGNGAYLDSLGWVYYRQNHLDQAETQLQQALERMGKDPTVHDHLGDVYFKEGKIKEAILQWQASLKEWEVTAPSEQDPAEISKISKKLENARVRVAKGQQR